MDFCDLEGILNLVWTPPLSLNTEIRGCARLLGEPLGLLGKDVLAEKLEATFLEGEKLESHSLR